jgi:DNA-binding PadR family transcriptional regulator
VPTSILIGELEQIVLLSILGSPEGVSAIEIRQRLTALLPRPISRGALYKTLDRVEGKGWVSWELDDEDVPDRGGYPRRRFRVTPEGVRALAGSRALLLELWSGLEEVLG